MLGENPQIVNPEMFAPTVQKKSIDYTEILQKLGLKESKLTAEIVDRLKNHLTLYKNGAEANLTLLEERVTGKTDEMILSDWMNAEAKRISENAPENALAIGGADTIVEKGIINTEDEIKSQINAKLESSPIGKIANFLGFDSSWILENGKKYFSTETSGLGKTLFSLALTFLGIKGVEAFFDKKDQVGANISGGVGEIPQAREQVGNMVDENKDIITPIEENIQDFEKKQDTYTTIGNIFFLQIAGESYEKGNSKNAMLENIQNKPWKKLQEIYAQFLEKNNQNDSNAIYWMYTELGIDKKNYSHSYDDKTLVNIMNSIAGPVPTSIITQRVSIDSINSLIEGGKVEEKLGKDFVTSIKNKSPEELTFKQISIIYTLLFPGIVTEKFKEGKNTVLDFVFGKDNSDDVVKTFEHELTERRKNIVSDEAVKEILLNASGTIYMIDDSSFRTLLKGKVSNQEIEKIISFKTDFISNLIKNPKYNLGYTGFERKIHEKVTYQDILSMYVLLNGISNIANLPELESTGLYMWIVGVTGEDKEYVSKLTLEVVKETGSLLSPIEKEILYKNLSRLSKVVADIMFEQFRNVSGIVRASIGEVAKNEFGIDIFQSEIDATEWGIIVGIIGTGSATMLVPHPLVKLIGGSIIVFGGSYAFAKLYDYGTFGKLEQYHRGTKVYDLMNDILEETYGKNISEIANAKSDGVSGDKIFGE